MKIDNTMKAAREKARKAKNIWYAWYPGDYAAKTATLTMVEDGAYRRLLDHYYQMNGKVVANATLLLRACRAFDTAEVAAVHAALAQFFVERDGYYHHERADDELAKREELRNKRAAAGSKGGKQKVANATVLLDVCHTQHNTTQKEVVATAAHVAIATKPPEAQAAPAMKADVVPIRPQPEKSKREQIFDRLCQAIGWAPENLYRVRAFENFGSVYADWVSKGCDPDKDIWPTIAKLAGRLKNVGKPITTPNYFEAAIFTARDDRLAAMPTPSEMREKFDGAVGAFKLQGWWHDDFGPKPFEPGCQVPAEILAKHFPQNTAAMQ